MTANLFTVIMLFIWVLVFLGLDLFVKFKKLDQLESYFGENQYLQDNKRFWGRNQMIDKTMRHDVLLGFFMRPRSYVRGAKVTKEELDAVPLALKRLVTWPYYSGGIWFLCSCFWYVWAKW